MKRISAGSYDLNKWLYGGYETDVITTIYGEAGTGKTNFCLLAAVSQAKRGEKVIYVDTEGGFSSERIKQLVNGENVENILKNILILKPTNFQEQKEVFDKLLQYVKEHFSLIIVDGMTMLYRLDFADAKEAGVDELKSVNAELARQLGVLAEISRKQNIPVIVTNQVYHWDSQIRMVAGDILKYWSKCLIELTNDKGKRLAKLVKHRSLPQKEIYFQITERGISRKGWM